jgi:hypothetical protein
MRIMGNVTQQGENAGMELFYKSKLSLTPKRKVASYVGRLCEEVNILLIGNTGLTWQAFLQMKTGELFG